MACCVDCKYGQYESEPKSFGSDPNGDVWCAYWGKWVGCSGKCDQYK